MAIVNEIKCARCDRKYSGVRSRCPYCGARRIGRGKYSEDSDNAKGKMLISVLILSVLVVAVGVLLFTTPTDADDVGTEDDPSITTPEDEIDVVQGIHPEPTPIPTPTPEPTPVAPMNIQSITFTWNNGNTVLNPDVSLSRGDTLGIQFRVEPPGINLADFSIEWASSNEEAVAIVPTVMGDDGLLRGATLTGIGAGTATISVTLTNPAGEEFTKETLVRGGS